MTLIIKSDKTKNGIILKENTKKFEEATSTSGCDLEMSEITSSIPLPLTINNSASGNNVILNTHLTAVVDIIEDNSKYGVIKEETLSDIEDVIDGFSVFSFITEDDLIKFSIKSEKIEADIELDCGKSKKVVKSKKLNKFIKEGKESPYNDESNDIYDFHGHAESPPSSQHSVNNLNKLFNKKFSPKYIKHYKPKFKLDCQLSPSEGNSSSTSATEFRVPAESPRPTSNDDNNVVSTTTPDNVNIELEQRDLAKCVEVISPLKTASLRLYKLDEDLSVTSQTTPTPVSTATANLCDVNTSGSDNIQICTNTKQATFVDGNEEDECQQTIIPTKFSVDLLTKINEKQAIIDEANKCLGNNLSNASNCDWNSVRKSPDVVDSNNSFQISSNRNIKHIPSATTTTTPTTTNCDNSNSGMMSAVVKNQIGNGCCSTAVYRDGCAAQPGSCKEARLTGPHDSALAIGEEGNSDSNNNNSKHTVSSPMQSWLELHNKGLLHQQQLQQQQQSPQTTSNSTIMPTKCASSNSFNGLSSSSHSTKSQHESVPFDWKNNYFDSSKLLTNSTHKYSQNFGALSQDLVNNIRYQQEQQELMNALRLKHENSKIPKPLVHMGLDSLYKTEHSLNKNYESRFQAPSVHNYFMSNSQLPTEFNTANVFKSRSDFRSRQGATDTGSNKDSFTKALPSVSSTNFKAPDIVKRRGQWCDMHVKIAYFIYRSQKRVSMLKSQELNSQLSQLMYSQKMPQNGPVSTPSAYQSGFNPHSSPYLDYKSSQLKSDPGYPNYQPKPTNAFLHGSSRSLPTYHSLIQPPSLDGDYLPSGNHYDDHHYSPEQKWLRLLSNYMTNHPMPSSERPSPEVMNQIYSWYQQFAQTNNPMSHFNPLAPPPVPAPASNVDPNMMYLRKYMEHLSSYLGSMKQPESVGYQNSQMTERDMQIYLMKQQQYQKALMSKYHGTSVQKPRTINHGNPLLFNSSNNPFYGNSKIPVNGDPLMSQYPECLQSLINKKYRVTHEQIRQMRQESSFSSTQSRNGVSKLVEPSQPKRRKLNPEARKPEVTPNGFPSDKEDRKSVTDLTGDYVNLTSAENNCPDNIDLSVDRGPTKSRESGNYNLQPMAPENND